MKLHAVLTSAMFKAFTNLFVDLEAAKFTAIQVLPAEVDQRLNMFSVTLIPLHGEFDAGIDSVFSTHLRSMSGWKQYFKAEI